jgi:hypothetical protein
MESLKRRAGPSVREKDNFRGALFHYGGEDSGSAVSAMYCILSQ